MVGGEPNTTNTLTEQMRSEHSYWGNGKGPLIIEWFTEIVGCMMY